jgi:hypothetical protein
MSTGADSDPKQLPTYSPNFSFRKFCYWRNESYTKQDPALDNQFGAVFDDIGLHPDNITHVVPSVLRQTRAQTCNQVRP